MTKQNRPQSLETDIDNERSNLIRDYVAKSFVMRTVMPYPSPQESGEYASETARMQAIRATNIQTSLRAIHGADNVAVVEAPITVAEQAGLAWDPELVVFMTKGVVVGSDRAFVCNENRFSYRAL